MNLEPKFYQQGIDSSDCDNAIILENVDYEKIETILLYFGNKKKSGGGHILNHDYKDGDLIIYYQDENTVKSVLNFGNVIIREQIFLAKKYVNNCNFK